MTCLLCAMVFWALYLQFSIHLPRMTYSPVTSFPDPWIRVDNAMSEAPGAACSYRRETSTTLSRFVPYIFFSCHTGQRTMHRYIYHNSLFTFQRLLPFWHCWLFPYNPKVSWFHVARLLFLYLGYQYCCIWPS